MVNFFEKVCNKLYVIDLMTEIQMEFGNEDNKLPSKREFENFLLEREKKLNNILQRLTESERVIFLNKLKKDLSKYYSGIRRHFLEQISPDKFVSEFPQHMGKDKIRLTDEEIRQLEIKYSLYPFFQQLLDELLNTIADIEKAYSKNTGVVDDNPHPRIFTDLKHFKLFEHWHNGIKRNQLAEYSFIYWQMVKDGLIYESVRPTEFINWLNSNYEVALAELKQYDNCKGGGKLSRYQTAKLLFQ